MTAGTPVPEPQPVAGDRPAHAGGRPAHAAADPAAAGDPAGAGPPEPAGELARIRVELAGRVAALEEHRGAQLRRLADTALALSGEMEVEGLLRIVTEAARDLIGAHQAVTSRLVHGWSDALTHVSLSEKYARWRTYDAPPKGLGVLNAVTRENRPLRLTPEELVAHPEWRGLADAPDHPPLPDYLAAPLIARDGRNLGLIQLSDKVDGTPFSAEDEAILVQLAQMASVSVENAELIARERTARRDAERRARQQRVLSQASHAFSMSLDLEQTLSTVTSAMVPEFADWCGVLLPEGPGHLRLAATAALDPTFDRRMRRLIERAPHDPARRVGAQAVVRSGESQLYPVLTREVLAALASAEIPLAQLEPFAGASALVVPLPARGRNVGVLGMVRLNGRAYGEAELALAEDLGRRAALAVENATSYALERQAADRLLRALLPLELPEIPRASSGVHYRPGAAGSRIGGDWYDCFPLTGGRFGLVVGDVMGHGVAAASAMGQMRSALRAYALEGHRPAVVLDRLDALVQQLEEMALTTCVYAVWDPARGVLTTASAGHLPPLLVPAGGAPCFPEVPSGLPLGVGLGEVGYAEHDLDLDDGATVLLYTDGLVESRSAPIDEGLERLRSAAADLAEAGPQALCDALVASLADPSHHDDVALLALRVSDGDGDGDGEHARRRVAADEEVTAAGVALVLDRRSPARARAFVRERLAAWGCEPVADDVALLTSEIVTNAQLHGAPPLGVRVRRLRSAVRVEVEDGSDRLPMVKDYELEAGTGRGIRLLEDVADAWGAEATPGGKVVWFEVRA
jgi:serine phosphatase RsbU (regulator of sigma subunit)